MSKKWRLLICVLFEIKVFGLLLQHIAYLINPAKGRGGVFLQNIRLLRHWSLCGRATDTKSVGKTFLPLNESLPHKTHRSVFIVHIAVASVDAAIIPWVTPTAQRQ
jgi:hypothetical protein